MAISRPAASAFNQKQLSVGNLTPEHITELVAYWQEGHGLLVDGMAGSRETIPSIDWEIDRSQSALPEGRVAPIPQRGLVVTLTDQQIINRARYLAGELTIDKLDDHVRKTGAQSACPSIYYLLKGYNGGKDPSAADPADRWSKPGSTFINRTCDCSGGNSWMGGFDRYQPKRMRASVSQSSKRRDLNYDGWFNTDSKILDAVLPLKPGEARCFEAETAPRPSLIIVCKTGSPGHSLGHEGRIIDYRGDLSKFDPDNRAHWDLIDVVDVSAVGAGKRANLMRTGIGWYGSGAYFLRSVMTP